MAIAKPKKKNFLNKIKETLKVAPDADGMSAALQDGDVDLDSGVIKIEEADPNEAISTAEVLRAGEEGEGDELYKGQEKGLVYVLDLKPFFKAIGTSPNEKMGRNLIQFSENLLARMLKSGGTYTCHENEKFLFRLLKSDAEGWLLASKVVNDLGTHFLRDGFKPEDIIPEALAMVDLASAVDENGDIDPTKAIAAQRKIPEKLVEQTADFGPVWEYMGENDPDEEYVPEWQEDEDALRSATERVERGEDRRQRKLRFPADADRRRGSPGRRDEDDPHKSVW